MIESVKANPKRLALWALAVVMSGAEVLVSSGVPLPFSDQIPVWLRLVVIGLITSLAPFVRGKAKEDA
jgi:hypothetical protein